MTAGPHWTGNHTQLLWLAIVLILVITFLADAAGWFHEGWFPTP